MRTRAYLLAASALALGGILIALFPVKREVLRLEASGDPADQETLREGHALEQRLALPRAATIHATDILLRSPVPANGSLVIHLLSDTKRQTQTHRLAAVLQSGVVELRWEPVHILPEHPATLRMEVRELAGNAVAIATATGVPATFGGELRFNDRPLNRHLAVTVSETASVGIIVREYLAGGAAWFAALGSTTHRALFLGLAVGAATLLLLVSSLPERSFVLLLVMAGVLAFLAHEPFRTTYPVTNDEGSLLMDIQNVRAGYWPFRDVGATKGPLALALLAPIVAVTDHSLRAVRVAVSALAALEAILLGILAARLADKRAGLIAALLYALTPAVLAQTTQLFLQPFSLPLVTLSLITLAGGATPLATRFRFPRRVPRATLAGALFGLAFLARTTSFAFLPAAAVLLLAPARTPNAGGAPISQERLLRARLRSALQFGAGGAILLGLVAGAVWPWLGTGKTVDFLGGQGVRIGQERVAQGRAAGGLNIFWNGSISDAPRRLVQAGRTLLLGGAPLLVLTLAFLVQQLGTLVRLPRIVTALGLVALGVSFLPALRTSGVITLEPAYAAGIVWSSTAMVLACAAVIARGFAAPRGSARVFWVFIGVWVALVAGYANFGVFRNHYHAEFLPLYALAAGLFLRGSVRPIDPGTSLASAMRNNAPVGVLFLLVAAVSGALFPVALTHPHAGNIPLAVADEVAADLRQRTVPGEEIFTAQALFPFLADRFLPFGISHPSWYRDEALGNVPSELRQRYFPDRNTLRAYLEQKPIRVLVIERRTREIFLEFDPRLRELLTEQYTRARVFENPLLDSIEIWQRTNLP